MRNESTVYLSSSPKSRPRRAWLCCSSIQNDFTSSVSGSLSQIGCEQQFWYSSMKKSLQSLSLSSMSWHLRVSQTTVLVRAGITVLNYQVSDQKLKTRARQPLTIRMHSSFMLMALARLIRNLAAITLNCKPSILGMLTGGLQAQSMQIACRLRTLMEGWSWRLKNSRACLTIISMWGSSMELAGSEFSMMVKKILKARTAFSSSNYLQDFWITLRRIIIMGWPMKSLLCIITGRPFWMQIFMQWLKHSQPSSQLCSKFSIRSRMNFWFSFGWICLSWSIITFGTDRILQRINEKKIHMSGSMAFWLLSMVVRSSPACSCNSFLSQNSRLTKIILFRISLHYRISSPNLLDQSMSLTISRYPSATEQAEFSKASQLSSCFSFQQQLAYFSLRRVTNRLAKGMRPAMNFLVSCCRLKTSYQLSIQSNMLSKI